jgi:DNA-binding GntR family transcriptional regulator
VDNLGVFVSQFDARKLLQAYEVREVLEGLAARLCCEHASRSDLRELADLAQQIERLGREGRVEEMGRLDRQFHARTVQISQNLILLKLTESYRVLGMLVRADRPIDDVLREHLAILDAIERNDPDEAERLAREHVVAARQAIEAQIAVGGFEPKWVVHESEVDEA